MTLSLLWILAAEPQLESPSAKEFDEAMLEVDHEEVVIMDGEEEEEMVIEDDEPYPAFDI